MHQDTFCIFNVIFCIINCEKLMIFITFLFFICFLLKFNWPLLMLCLSFICYIFNLIFFVSNLKVNVISHFLIVESFYVDLKFISEGIFNDMTEHCVSFSHSLFFIRIIFVS